MWKTITMVNFDLYLPVCLYLGFTIMLCAPLSKSWVITYLIPAAGAPRSTFTHSRAWTNSSPGPSTCGFYSTLLPAERPRPNFGKVRIIPHFWSSSIMYVNHCLFGWSDTGPSTSALPLIQKHSFNCIPVERIVTAIQNNSNTAVNYFFCVAILD